MHWHHKAITFVSMAIKALKPNYFWVTSVIHFHVKLQWHASAQQNKRKQMMSYNNGEVSYHF